jgi:hypothetical protein
LTAARRFDLLGGGERPWLAASKNEIPKSSHQHSAPRGFTRAVRRVVFPPANAECWYEDLEMSEKLSERDRKRLEICERTICNGLQSCFDTGAALLEIRDFRLYREECETFEEYCQQHFRIGQNYANRLISSSEIKESVEHSKLGEKIVNEAQARELAKVPESKRVAVLRGALKISPNLNAQAIQEASKDPKIVPIGTIDQPIESGISQKKPSKIVILDSEGYPVPEPALEFWNRKSEVQVLLSAISKIKGVLKKAQESDDKMYREVMFSAVISDLTNAYTGIHTAMPYAVCTTCQGQVPGKCTLCRGRGMISKFRWETVVPSELKQLRIKTSK